MPLIWMLLLFSCGWVSTDSSIVQSLDLTAAYGSSVSLPCDGSAYVGEEDVEVSWEAMGTDVVSLKGNISDITERYKDRVSFISEEHTAAGDWSIVLDGVVLSDSDMYECIYRGRRTLSTVWLTVQHPQVDSVVEVHSENESVTLPCFLELPRQQSMDDLSVWWEKDGQILFERTSRTLNGSIGEDLGFDYFHPWNIDKFPLSLSLNMSLLVLGEFTCWYRIKPSQDPRPGIPGTINLILKEPFYEAGNSTEGSTEEWGSTPFWFLPFETTETPTEQLPVTLDQGASPLEESTEPLPMEAHEETATSFPDEDPEESVDWSDFPWVRTGLIAGVLLVTAAVLCILGALHKL